MLAYILGIKKRGNNGFTNWGRFYGLQIGARSTANRGSLRDFKSEQKDYKSGQGFHIGAKRFQNGAREITNRGRDYKSVQNTINHIIYEINKAINPKIILYYF